MLENTTAGIPIKQYETTERINLLKICTCWKRIKITEKMIRKPTILGVTGIRRIRKLSGINLARNRSFRKNNTPTIKEIKSIITSRNIFLFIDFIFLTLY